MAGRSWFFKLWVESSERKVEDNVPEDIMTFGTITAPRVLKAMVAKFVKDAITQSAYLKGCKATGE